MKLTESKLKQIIVEELQKVIIEQEMLQEESPRDIMKRIIAKTPGGFKGLKKLPFKHPDRVAYRAAYKAQRQGKKRASTDTSFDASKGAAGRLRKLGTIDAGSTDDVTVALGRKKATPLPPAADAPGPSKKVAAMIAKAKKDLGGYGKPGKKVDPASDDERRMQRAMALASDEEQYFQPSAGAGFKSREITPIK